MKRLRSLFSAPGSFFFDRSLYVPIALAHPPHRVQEIILAALKGSFGVLDEPAPSVVTNAFVDGSIEYWVRFFTDQFHKRDGVDGMARDRIVYALARAGITVSSPTRTVQLQDASLAAKAEEDAALAERQRAIGAIDLLAMLSDEQRRALAGASRTRLYIAGETIVREGDVTGEMFVVVSGEVTVELERGAHRETLARLGPGSFFGEMALMTGEPRNATVRAASPCSLLVIDHGAFKSILDGAPDLAAHISRVIAERQAARADRDAASAEGDRVSVEERSSQLLGRIRKFFALG